MNVVQGPFIRFVLGMILVLHVICFWFPHYVTLFLLDVTVGIVVPRGTAL